MMTSPEYREASRRMITESAAIMSLYFLLMLLGYDDDDDDLEKMSFWKLHLMYQVAKLKSETQTFGLSGSTELKGIYENPATSYFYLKNSTNLIGNLFNLMIGSEDAYYKRDAGLFKKGDAKYKKDLIKVLGINPVLKTIYPEELVRSYKQGQTLRDR